MSLVTKSRNFSYNISFASFLLKKQTLLEKETGYWQYEHAHVYSNQTDSQN